MPNVRLHPARSNSLLSGWSPSTVYEVLHRPLYRGEVVWNKTRKRDALKARPPSPRALRSRVGCDSTRPDLRIVSDEVWQAAQARLTRSSGTKLAAASSRMATGCSARRDIDSQYWLSGFARCGTCGGTRRP